MVDSGSFDDLPRLAKIQSYASAIAQVSMVLREDLVLAIDQLYVHAMDRYDSAAYIGEGHLIGVEWCSV